MYRFLSIFLLTLSVNCDNPEVEIPQGRLKGSIRTNFDGENFYSFRKIPFAKPPVGELRFMPPKPADVWEGILDATEDLPQCSQGQSSGQEDCLYLNVYTPGLPDANVTDLPVMVFIFGGAFIGGDAQATTYGPDFLLTKDVILVVTNYRVGLYGFLSLDDAELGLTGNAGLKDQVLALKWVRDNIKYFGGNSDNVLLFGQSGGGMSVHHHILSPLSKGLFKKGIAESGVSLKPTPEVRNNAAVLAEYIGIQTDDYVEMIAALQSVDDSVLTAIGSEMNSIYRYFRPIIEIPADGTFIQERPIDIIKAGTFNEVAFMVGFNDAEAKGELEVITDFEAYIPLDLEIESGSEEAAAIAARIKQHYYGDDEPSSDNPAPAIYLETDFGSGYPAYRTVVEMFKTAVRPLYFYLFSVDTELNYSNQRGRSSFPGAAHMDELAYLFSSSDTPEIIEEGSIEEINLRNMVNLWTNFAIYDTPTPEGYAFILDPVTADQFNYLNIDTDETTVKVNPKQSDMEFWAALYKEYYPE